MSRPPSFSMRGVRPVGYVIYDRLPLESLLIVVATEQPAERSADPLKDFIDAFSYFFGRFSDALFDYVFFDKVRNLRIMQAAVFRRRGPRNEGFLECVCT